MNALVIFMIVLYTAIFEKGRYLVAAFAVSLACAMLRYRLLKVSSVNYLRRVFLRALLFHCVDGTELKTVLLVHLTCLQVL